MSRLRREIAALKQKVSELEDREPIPFVGTEEELILAEVVTQTGLDVRRQPEGHDQWEEVAKRVELEHRESEKRVEGAEEGQGQQEGEAVKTKEATDLFAGLLQGVVGKQPEGNIFPRQPESEKVEKAEEEEGEEPKAQVSEEELWLLREENERLRKENRELKMRAEGEVEEAYPEEELNIRVTVTRDEDSEGEELKRENEELRERLEELKSGEELPFLDFVEEKRQSEKELEVRRRESAKSLDEQIEEGIEKRHSGKEGAEDRHQE